MIPLLDICPKKFKGGTQSNRCICIIIRALFKMPKRWKQPTYSSTDEWVNEKLYIHTIEYIIQP